MVYEIKKDNKIYFYEIIYNKEKLEEILEKLKKYSYISIAEENIAGGITRWPATKRNLEKRASSIFYSRYWNSHKTLLLDTITLHTDNNFNYVSYKYSFEKLPDLYHYIDILINIRNIMARTDLFGYDRIYTTTREQLCIEGILNYVDSPELIKNNSINIDETSVQEYDYKELNKLYQETLKCLNFKLIAIKEHVDSQEIVSSLSLQRKK